MTVQAVPTFIVRNVYRALLLRCRICSEKRINVVVASVRFLSFVPGSVVDIRVDHFAVQRKVKGSSFAEIVFIFTIFELLPLFVFF